MSKQEYAEFQKYLALLYYEYHKMLFNNNLTEERIDEIKEIIKAINRIKQICIIEGE